MVNVKKNTSIFKWIMNWIWTVDKRTFLLWATISILGALTPVVFLNVNKIIIDEISGSLVSNDSFIHIFKWIVIFVLFLFGQAIYGLVPGLLYPVLQNKYGIEMQRKLAESIQKLPLKMFDDSEMATKIGLVEKASSEAAFFLAPMLVVFTCVVSVVSLMIMTLQSSWIMFLAGILLLSFSIPMSILTCAKEHRLWEAEGDDVKIQNYYADLPFNRNLSKEYRLLQLNGFVRKRWYETAEPLRKRRRKVEEEIQRNWDFMKFVSQMLNFLMIFVGLTFIKSGKLTIGELVMFVSLFNQLSGNCSTLGFRFMEMLRSFKRLVYLKDFFETDFQEKYEESTNEKIESPIVDESDKSAPVFELKNVSYSYCEDTYALKDVSFKINRGEIVALVGNNGAGKSTLIKLLLGFYIPTEGKLFFEGKDYRNVDFSKFVNRMGVSFQDYAKFEFTIRDNVAFGDINKVNEDKDLCEALQKSGAINIVDRMQDGIDTYIGRWYTDKGTQMSGGEWQKMCLARAHVSNREIMILDEPAAMLDPIAEMEQFYSVKDSVQDRTAILISHRIGFARLADKVAVLDKGKLVEFGTHDELIKLNGKYYELFTTQAEWYQKEGVINE